MLISRRDFTAGAAALLASASSLGIARAQEWNPTNLRVIVPFSAGGSVDALGRLVADGLKQGRSGGSFLVENRTGASGSVGANAVAKSPPDGNTWLLTFDIHAVLPSLIPNLPYDNEKDLVPVTLIGTSPMVFVTGRNSPFQTFEQMVAHAKSKGTINYGSGSAGTLGHLTMTMIAEKAGISMTHVNYRGGTPALNDAIAGHIDGFIGSSSIVAQHIASGTVKPILQTSRTRSAALPNVPTAIELGFKDIEGDAWWAIFAPGGTPQPIVNAFLKEVRGIFAQPANQKVLTESYHIKTVLNDPDQFKQFFDREMRVWGKVVRDHKIQTAS